MNDTEKVVVGVSIAWIGLSVRSMYKTIRRERARRQEIAVQLDRKLLAITDAHMKIEDMINTGKFDGVSIGNMLDQFELEIIKASRKY